jgi:hypothetical protein
MLTVSSRTLMAGIMTWPSPCGPDCSYNQSFVGPSFSCSPAQSNATGSAVLRWSTTTQKSNTADTFSIEWLSDYSTLIMSYTSCVAYNSTYHIGVHYSNNTQIVDVQQTELHSSFGTNNTIPGDPNGEQYLSIILELSIPYL